MLPRTSMDSNIITSSSGVAVSLEKRSIHVRANEIVGIIES